MVEVSAVIVEYRHPAECLRSLEGARRFLGGTAAELFVVSNSNYSERARERVEARLARTGARTLFAPRNLGYAGAVNLALREASGRFVLVLNPDCVHAEGSARDAIRLFEDDPSLGLVGFRLVGADGAQEENGRPFPRWTSLAGRTLARSLRRTLSDETPPPGGPQWVSGAAMLVRRAALDEVGGMDPRYFLYLEDVDLCLALQLRGRRVALAPGCVFVHEGRRASTGGGFRAALRPLFWTHVHSALKFFRKNARALDRLERTRQAPSPRGAGPRAPAVRPAGPPAV